MWEGGSCFVSYTTRFMSTLVTEIHLHNSSDNVRSSHWIIHSLNSPLCTRNCHTQVAFLPCRWRKHWRSPHCCWVNMAKSDVPFADQRTPLFYIIIVAPNTTLGDRCGQVQTVVRKRDLPRDPCSFPQWSLWNENYCLQPSPPVLHFLNYRSDNLKLFLFSPFMSA